MTECRHIQSKVVYVGNEEGDVELEICTNDECAKVIRAKCEHIRNKWVYTRNQGDPDEQKLVCDLCGADGT